MRPLAALLLLPPLVTGLFVLGGQVGRWTDRVVVQEPARAQSAALPSSHNVVQVVSPAQSSVLPAFSAHGAGEPPSQRADWIARVVAGATPVNPLIVDVRDQRSHPVTPYAVWAVVRDAFPPHEYVRAMRVAACESTNNPALRYLDVNGLVSAGMFSVQEHIWGAVPPDLPGQARQAAAIVAEYGWRPWACAR